MDSRVLSEGDKIEFSEVLSATQKNDGMKANVYVSQIFEINDGRHMRVAMPIKQGRVIPLSKGKEYDMFFYTSNGMFKSRAIIVDRFKSGGIYSMEIELTTEVEKYQRRQYYRLETSIPVYYAEITDSEFNYINTEKKFPDRLFGTGVCTVGNTLDISGGGLRFRGPVSVQTGSRVLAMFEIKVEDKHLKYRLPSSVILSEEMQNNRGKFEHRIEFDNISEQYREMLIKYIFEEERRIRKRTS